METTELLQQELKAAQDAIVSKVEALKKANADEAVELKNQIAAVQRQADAIDMKLAGGGHGGYAETKSLESLLKEDEGFSRLQRDRKGSAVLNISGEQLAALERKAAIDSAAVGVSTSGVLRIDRTAGIVAEARQTLTLRNLLTARPTSLQVIDFVKVNSPMVVASPQIETHTKLENAVTFTTASERVRTLATWIPASRQVLDDFSELAAFINDSLMYYVALAEEQQMLTGSGSGEDLRGLITQATAFDTALLTGSWTRIDQVGAAIQQINEAKEIDPSFIVLNPRDWWNIRRTKDSFGRYILGDPNTPDSRRIWDLNVDPTNNMTAGSFLVGSGNPAATEIRDRMEMQVEVSTQHGTYFTENMVAVRCEKRVALVTKRPASFIYGTFTTSPA